MSTTFTSGPCEMEEADPEADVVDGSPMDVVNPADDSVQVIQLLTPNW
jgi:hypothetical protein